MQTVEARSAYNKRYYRAHKEIWDRSNAQRPGRGKQTAAYAAAWRAKNPDKARAIRKRSEAKNPEAKRARVRNRRARLRQAKGSHTAGDIEHLFKLQRGRCAHPWCGASLKSGYHVDHIEALALGGSNDPSNLQLLCAPCNRAKHTKSPITLANRNGFLL